MMDFHDTQQAVRAISLALMSALCAFVLTMLYAEQVVNDRVRRDCAENGYAPLRGYVQVQPGIACRVVPARKTG